MFDDPGCVWCRRWNAEIGPSYPQSPRRAAGAAAAHPHPRPGRRPAWRCPRGSLPRRPSCWSRTAGGRPHRRLSGAGFLLPDARRAAATAFRRCSRYRATVVGCAADRCCASADMPAPDWLAESVVPQLSCVPQERYRVTRGSFRHAARDRRLLVGADRRCSRLSERMAPGVIRPAPLSNAPRESSLLPDIRSGGPPRWRSHPRARGPMAMRTMPATAHGRISERTNLKRRDQRPGAALRSSRRLRRRRYLALRTFARARRARCQDVPRLLPAHGRWRSRPGDSVTSLGARCSAGRALSCRTTARLRRQVLASPHSPWIGQPSRAALRGRRVCSRPRASSARPDRSRHTTSAYSMRSRWARLPPMRSCDRHQRLSDSLRPRPSPRG